MVSCIRHRVVQHLHVVFHLFQSAYRLVDVVNHHHGGDTLCLFLFLILDHTANAECQTDTYRGSEDADDELHPPEITCVLLFFPHSLIFFQELSNRLQK